LFTDFDVDFPLSNQEFLHTGANSKCLPHKAHKTSTLQVSAMKVKQKSKHRKGSVTGRFQPNACIASKQLINASILLALRAMRALRLARITLKLGIVAYATEACRYHCSE